MGDFEEKVKLLLSYSCKDKEKNDILKSSKSDQKLKNIYSSPFMDKGTSSSEKSDSYEMKSEMESDSYEIKCYDLLSKFKICITY